MVCQECGERQATLHFTKIVNGEKAELHICEACAREKGELIPGTASGFSIHNLLSGLLDQSQAGGAGVKAAAQPRCETCGMTYAQFSKLGKFGCSQCYKHFGERLDPLLKRVHGSTTHTGKFPKRTGGKLKVRREIERLKTEMRGLIAQEDFEGAARLRDQIRQLEKDMTG